MVGIIGCTVARYTCYYKAIMPSIKQIKLKIETNIHFHEPQIPEVTKMPNDDIKTIGKKKVFILTNNKKIQSSLRDVLLHHL